MTNFESTLERKFSAENWKIFDELREEKRKLHIFNASDLSEEGNEYSSLLSPYHYAENSKDSSLIVSEGQKVVEKCCIGSSLNCYQQSFLCGIGDSDKQLKEIPHEESNDCFTNKHSLLEITSKNKSFTNKKPLLVNKVSLLPFPENDEETFSNFIPPALKSLLCCLLNVKKLQKFLKDINKELLINQRKDIKEQYPTISFFLDAFNVIKKKDGAMNHFKIRFQADELSLLEEPPSSILMSILELLHEELIQAKSEEYLKQTCIEQCRFIHKQNHTTVSHLFRGHLKKKMHCECGYTKVLDETFTTITVPLEDLEEKLLIVKVVGRKGTNMVNTRYNFTVNSWSTVGSLKDKMVFMKMIQTTQQSLVMCLITEARQPHILHDSLILFEVMLAEGEIYAFETSLCHLFDDKTSLESPSNLPSNLSFNTTNAELSCRSYGKLETSKKIRNMARLFVYFYSLKLSVHYSFLVLKFPHFCLGLDIYECIARLLNTSFAGLKISIKNKSELCIFCMTLQCSGCPVQLCDKVTVSDQYSMIVVLPYNVEMFIEEAEDVSVTENQPINFFSLDECIRAFAYKKEKSFCPVCFQFLWKPEIIFLKCPDVLTIQLSNLCEYRLLYQHKMLRPYFSKSPGQEFLLTSLIIKDSEYTAFIKHCRGAYPKKRLGDEDTWVMHSNNKTLTVTSLPESEIELLFYIKNHETFVQKSGTHSKILNRAKKQKDVMVATHRSFDGNTDIKKNLGRKKYDRSGFESSSSYPFKSCYSRDTPSLCNCIRCKCLEQLHLQIVQSRSSLDTLSAVNVLAKGKSPNNVSHNETSERYISSNQSNSFHLENNLHQAIRKQNLKSAVKYLREGADVNYLHRGLAAIHLSAGMSSPFGCAFAQLCLDYGADPNLATRGGFTPLHIATTGNQEETIKLLLKAGGSPNIKDFQGRNCYDILSQKGGKHSERILRIFRGEENQDQRFGSLRNESLDEVSLLHAIKRDDVNQTELLGKKNDVNSPLKLSSGNESHAGECNLQSDLNQVSSTDFKESIVTEHYLQSVSSDISFNQGRQNTWKLFRRRKSLNHRNSLSERRLDGGLIHRLVRWFNRLISTF